MTTAIPLRMSVFLKSIGVKPDPDVPDCNVVNTMLSYTKLDCWLTLLDREGCSLQGPEIKFPNGTLLVAMEKPMPIVRMRQLLLADFIPLHPDLLIRGFDNLAVAVTEVEFQQSSVDDDHWRMVIQTDTRGLLATMEVPKGTLVVVWEMKLP